MCVLPRINWISDQSEQIGKKQRCIYRNLIYNDYVTGENYKFLKNE